MEMLSPEKLAHIKAVLNEMDANTANQSLIQDNKILFTFKDKSYRCRMPNQYEQSLAEDAQHKFKIKLSQEAGNVSRRQLIIDLKNNNNIDIEKLEKEKNELRQKLQDIYLELALVPSDNKNIIEEKRKAKNRIETEFLEISIEIADALAPCIQKKAEVEFYRMLSYVCTDVQFQDEQYEKAWKFYEEYLKDNSGLTYKALECMHSLLLNVRD